MDRDTALLLVGAMIAFASSFATAFAIYSFSLRTNKLKREEEKAVRRRLQTTLPASDMRLGGSAKTLFPQVHELWVKLAQLEEMAKAGYEANPVYASVEKELMEELEEAEELLRNAAVRRARAGETQDDSTD